MLVPMDKNALIEYSLVGDEGDNKTIFRLGYLNSRQKAALAIQSKKSTKDTEENSIWWFDIIRFGLRGWTNFKLSNGNEYEFKTDKAIISGFGEFVVMHQDCFEAFTLDQVAELAGKLYELNYIPVMEKKS